MEVIFSGFLAGLSVGVFCLGFCLPIFVPYLLSQSRTPRSSFWITVEFSLGFFTGINVCPPFLLSLSYIFNLRSAALGALYFLAFFTATSLYIVPLGFLGVFSKSPVFQKIAQVSAFLTGCVFLLSGIRTLR